jgi:hypothetical protein
VRHGWVRFGWVAHAAVAVHHAPMVGRALAACGWLAWQVRRRAPGGGMVAPVAAGVVCLVLAIVPLVIPLFDAQPQDATVEEIRDGAVTQPDGWVRLTGRVQPLSGSPTGEDGHFALLIDAANSLRAIVIRADRAFEVEPSTTISGHLATAGVVVTEELPIEATVFGAPPTILGDRVIDVDAAPKTARATWWPLSILPLLLGLALLVGAWAGYPVFRPSSEVDVVSAPLGPGERIPAAYGGRIGSIVADLADPLGALLLVRRGPKGNLLTAQPLAEGGGIAPQPVTIGGSWTSGRVGHVFALRETVAALRIRSELVDATFLFAKTSERDRIAALVAVDR